VWEAGTFCRIRNFYKVYLWVAGDWRYLLGLNLIRQLIVVLFHCTLFEFDKKFCWTVDLKCFFIEVGGSNPTINSSKNKLCDFFFLNQIKFQVFFFTDSPNWTSLKYFFTNFDKRLSDCIEKHLFCWLFDSNLFVEERLWITFLFFWRISFHFIFGQIFLEFSQLGLLIFKMSSS
jgi:hypothetical protein